MAVIRLTVGAKMEVKKWHDVKFGEMESRTPEKWPYRQQVQVPSHLSLLTI